MPSTRARGRAQVRLRLEVLGPVGELAGSDQREPGPGRHAPAAEPGRPDDDRREHAVEAPAVLAQALHRAVVVDAALGGRALGVDGRRAHRDPRPARAARQREPAERRERRRADQRPFHAGLRFAANARGPSTKSSLRIIAAICS
jgi:hypothetical protein